MPLSLANKIAAGEVVQRPASALKELIENAIDAGATEVKVLLKSAGSELIQVIDNGCGMCEADALSAFERHATSKIQSIEDLETIRTLGFRGEALASIAAVSQVELKTRRLNDDVGICVHMDGGVLRAIRSRVRTRRALLLPSGMSFLTCRHAEASSKRRPLSLSTWLKRFSFWLFRTMKSRFRSITTAMRCMS